MNILERLLPHKAKGVTCGVMYHDDLFPTAHAESCNISPYLFESWVRETIKYADFFACTSRYAINTLIEYSEKMYPYRKIDKTRVFTFPLGTDFQGLKKEDVPDKKLSVEFERLSWKESAQILFEKIDKFKSAQKNDKRDIGFLFKFPDSVDVNLSDYAAAQETLRSAALPVNFDISAMRGMYENYRSILQELRKRMDFDMKSDLKSSHRGLRSKISITLKKFFFNLNTPFFNKQKTFNVESDKLLEMLVSEIIFLKIEVKHLSKMIGKEVE
jgi:hypothetical protein